MTKNDSNKFISIFNESAMTFLSFFSLSLIGLVFGNVASYLQAIIFLRDEALIKSILCGAILIAVCIVYFLQSDNKGYRLEVGLKFNVKQLLISTGIAALIYIDLYSRTFLLSGKLDERTNACKNAVLSGIYGQSVFGYAFWY